MTVPVAASVATPSNIDDRDAGAIWMQCLTAWGALVEIAEVGADDWVVVPAASSSVGIASIQLCRARGAKVIATTTSAAKVEALRRFAPDAIVDTRAEPYVERVQGDHRRPGARVIFDPIYGPIVNDHIRVACREAIVFVYGALDATPLELGLGGMLRKQIRLQGYTLGPLLADPARRRACAPRDHDATSSAATSRRSSTRTSRSPHPGRAPPSRVESPDRQSRRRHRRPHAARAVTQTGRAADGRRTCRPVASHRAAARTRPRVRRGLRRLGLDLPRDPHRRGARAADGPRRVRFLLAGGGMLLALARDGPSRRRRPGASWRLAVMACTHAGRRQRARRVGRADACRPGFAALMVATVPIWMAGLAALPPARERLPPAAIVGLVLGFLGVAVLVRPGAGGDVVGALALVLAALLVVVRIDLLPPRRHPRRSDHGHGMGDVLRRPHVPRPRHGDGRRLHRAFRRRRARRHPLSGRRRARGSGSRRTCGSSPTSPRPRPRPTPT